MLPGLADTLAQLVAALDWHGALSMDLIAADSGPVIIDINPRLVEPANALVAGVDLVAAMLDVARNARPRVWFAGNTGVRTRQTLLAILGAAAPHGTRGAILREASDAIFARGDYTGSIEELTPVVGDPVRGGAYRCSARCVIDPPAPMAEISRRRGRALRSHAESLGPNSGGGRMTSAAGAARPYDGSRTPASIGTACKSGTRKEICCAMRNSHINRARGFCRASGNGFHDGARTVAEP